MPIIGIILTDLTQPPRRPGACASGCCAGRALCCTKAHSRVKTCLIFCLAMSLYAAEMTTWLSRAPTVTHLSLGHSPENPCLTGRVACNGALNSTILRAVARRTPLCVPRLAEKGRQCSCLASRYWPWQPLPRQHSCHVASSRYDWRVVGALWCHDEGCRARQQ